MIENQYRRRRKKRYMQSDKNRIKIKSFHWHVLQVGSGLCRNTMQHDKYTNMQTSVVWIGKKCITQVGYMLRPRKNGMDTQLVSDVTCESYHETLSDSTRHQYFTKKKRLDA